MSTVQTRIARLTAASALVLGLGALGAGPAFANGTSWAGSASPDSIIRVADDDASPDARFEVAMRAANDGATPENYSSWAG